MGQLRFMVARRDGRLTQLLGDTTYVCGSDGFPYRTRVEWEGAELVVDRFESDSGSVHTAWPIRGRGILMLRTTALRERTRPYSLELELARGTLSRAKRLTGQLSQVELELPGETLAELREASKEFYCASASSRDSRSWSNHCLRSVELAVDAIYGLTAALSDAFLARRVTPRLSGLLFGLPYLDDSVQPVLSTVQSEMDSVALPIHWPEIEPRSGEFDWSTFDDRVAWCSRQGWRIVAGPIVSFSPSAMPPWLSPSGGGSALREAVVHWTRAIVDRYRGRVHTWKVVGRVLGESESPFFNSELRLQLAAACLDAARHTDRNSERIISFEDPWAEYAARRDVRCSPTQYADALVRANVGITLIDLQIHMARMAGGVALRDPLEVVDRLDLWGRLGVPLAISLILPVGDSRGLGSPTSLESSKESAAADATFHNGDLMRLLISHPYVTSIFWDQLRDDDPPGIPEGGLFRCDGSPKPLWRRIRDWLDQRSNSDDSSSPV